MAYKHTQIIVEVSPALLVSMQICSASAPVLIDAQPNSVLGEERQGSMSALVEPRGDVVAL